MPELKSFGGNGGVSPLRWAKLWWSSRRAEYLGSRWWSSCWSFLWSLVMVIILLLVIGMVRNSMVAIAIVMMVVWYHCFFSCVSPFFQLDVKSCWSRSFDHKDNVLPASLSWEVYNLMIGKFWRWEWKLDHPVGRNIPPAGNPNMHLQRLSFDQSLSLKSVSILLRLEKRYMQNIATATSILQCIIQKICIYNAPLSIKVCRWQISQPQLLI